MTTSTKSHRTREEVHTILRKLAAEHLGLPPERIQPECQLLRDLGADSLGVVELSMAIEEEFGVALPEAMFEKKDVTMAELESALLAQLSKDR